MLNLTSALQQECEHLALWGGRFLIQSSLLIGAGLLICFYLRNSSAALRSSVLRITLASAIICPLISMIGIFKTINISVPRGTAAMQQGVESSPTRDPRLVRVAAPLERVNKAASFVPGDVGPPVSDSSGLPAPIALSPASQSLEPTPAYPLNSMAEQICPYPSKTYDSSDLTSSREGHWSGIGTLYCVLSACWLLCALFFSFRLWRHYHRSRVLCDSARLAPEWVLEDCRRTASKLGVACPAVLESPFVQSPVLTGIVRPAILLPVSNADAKGAQVLIHELAHLSRLDCLWNAIGRVATSLLFFQPLLWKLRQSLEETSEEVCDDYVLFYDGNKSSYARRLVALAETLGYCPAMNTAGIGVVNLRSSLGRRVKRILEGKANRALKTGYRTLLTMNAFSLGMIVCVSLLGVSSSVSLAETSGKTFELKSSSCVFLIDPSNMMVVAKPKSGQEFQLSQAVPDLGAVSVNSSTTTTTFPGSWRR